MGVQAHEDKIGGGGRSKLSQQPMSGGDMFMKPAAGAPSRSHQTLLSPAIADHEILVHLSVDHLQLRSTLTYPVKQTARQSICEFHVHLSTSSQIYYSPCRSIYIILNASNVGDTTT